jgi:hypothetical protein
MGRPAKPIEILKLTNTYRPSRHGVKTAADGWPPLPETPPVKLTAEEAAIWREIVPFAAHLRAVDARLVAAYCAAAATSNVAVLLRLGRELKLTPTTRPLGSIPRKDVATDWSRLKQKIETPVA